MSLPSEKPPRSIVADIAGWRENSVETTTALYQLPGFTLRAVGAASRIAGILLPAFRHLTAQQTTGTTYDWHLIDIPESEAAALSLPDPSQYGTFQSNHDGSRQVERRGPVITLFDHNARQITTLALKGQLVRSDQAAKPLLRFLFAMTEAEGWYMAHAALFGLGGTGILVPGGGGAGKSTLAAACVSAGAEFAGDDFVAVRHIDGDWVGHSLFSTLMLFASQAAEFPDLPQATCADGVDNARKTHLRVSTEGGLHPVRRLKIDACAIPEISQTPESVLIPARRGNAAKAILPHSAILAPPVRGVAHTQTLLRLAAELPAFTFQSGSDYRRSIDPLRDRYGH